MESTTDSIPGNPPVDYNSTPPPAYESIANQAKYYFDQAHTGGYMDTDQLEGNIETYERGDEAVAAELDPATLLTQVSPYGNGYSALHVKLRLVVFLD